MNRYSVVVIAHDHPRQLLASLLHLQRHADPAEVLVVDNASQGDLSGVIGLSQLRVRQVRLTAPQSLAMALNAGLDAAANDLVLLLHGDVLLRANPAAAVARLRDDPRVGIVGGHLLTPSPSRPRTRHAGYEAGRGRIAPRNI